MKNDNQKADDLAIEASRLVSAGFEALRQTGEYDYEMLMGPYETLEDAEEAMNDFYDGPNGLRATQFFHANTPLSESAQHKKI